MITQIVCFLSVDGNSVPICDNILYLQTSAWSLSFRNLNETTFSGFEFGGVPPPLLQINGKKVLTGTKKEIFLVIFGLKCRYCVCISSFRNANNFYIFSKCSTIVLQNQYTWTIFTRKRKNLEILFIRYAYIVHSCSELNFS